MLVSLLATLAAASGLFLALFNAVRREMLARREAEQALRVSDRYNRSIVDSSPDCLSVLTLDGRLVQMTPQGQRLMDVEDFSSIANSDWLAQWGWRRARLGGVCHCGGPRRQRRTVSRILCDPEGREEMVGHHRHAVTGRPRQA